MYNGRQPLPGVVDLFLLPVTSQMILDCIMIAYGLQSVQEASQQLESCHVVSIL